MKNEEMLNSMDLIDDEYVEEASPQKTRATKKLNTKWLKFGIIAACLAIMLIAFNLVLFLPHGVELNDISEYRDSPYYAIIEKINVLSAKQPEYANNFEKWFGAGSAPGVDFDASGGALNPDYSENAPSTDIGAENDNYQEVTDNQVEGVIEGDIIKRSDKHIYYYSSSYSEIRIYSIEKESSRLVGSYNLQELYNKYGSYGIHFNEKENIEEVAFTSIREMYLSNDCKTLFLISSTHDKSWNSMTVVTALDVSNPEKVTQRDYAIVEGSFISSRMVNGRLLIFNGFGFKKSPDFSKPETYIPSITCKGNSEATFVSPSNIACPDTITSTYYTVGCMLDLDLDVVSTCAFLSYSDDIYVSCDAVYAVRKYTEKTNGENKFGEKYEISHVMSDVSCFAYNENGFTNKGAIKLSGYIKDRYSLDEYNGILRVVTTTDKYISKYFSFQGNESFTLDVSTGTSASLYCIDLDTWSIVSSVNEFAPKGETVRSVRFDKQYAYVCTAIQLTDPVFFFDLSDINNITYKETGTIEGFSTSLINLGNGYLLGIGVGDLWNKFKIEIYKEDMDGVASVCSYELDNTSYSTEYKSYFIDRERKLVGLGVCKGNETEENANSYILLHFDGVQLNEVINTSYKGNYRVLRGVLIDDYFYLLSNYELKVIPV